ncbi:hypothetical protein P4E94_16765, partial [Pontiellaceae bacterium B12219]|nr:hypothetical protein [Pontiellaceae bacterium B12219]
TNAFTLVHTNDAVLTWTWSTNYWLEVDSIGAGSITFADGWYREGTTNVLSAIPEPGYSFVGWSGSIDSTNSLLTVVMTEAHSLTAIFTNDRDNDDLPDWWETQYFGDPTNAVASAISSNGINTLLEAYIAGLDPTDSESVFEVYGYNEIVGGTNQFVLEWDSQEGRYYNIHWTSNLFNGFQPLETGLEFPRNTYTGEMYSASNSFYRLEVELK